MKESYRPRFTFEITPEQQKRADRLLTTYGLRRSIFSPILDDVLDLVEEYGQIVIGVLLDEKVKSHQVIPSVTKVKERCKE